MFSESVRLRRPWSQEEGGLVWRWVGVQDDSRLIGEAAKNQAAQNPTNTVYDAKRLIGRKFSDATVQR